MEQEEKTFLNVERTFFGFDHAEIASEICENWMIPAEIRLAIRCHHRPSLSDGDDLPYILRLADYVATMDGIGYDDDDALCELENGTMDFVEIGGYC